MDGFAVLRLRGAGALSFLQGQLSNDVERLRGERTLLAGLHNPQGRVIAVLRLIALAPEDVLALLPRELAGEVLTRLRKYVLRAKVQIEDDSEQWRIEGGWGAVPADTVALSIPGGRFLAPRAGEPAVANPDDTARWLAADIAAGLPQVYGATSEAFVGQMLNLDLVDAISFTKGCYTGQEVIARAHYRGRVKRRMQRFRTLHRTPLLPGDSFRLRDERVLRIVYASPVPGGGSEFLAVAPFEHAIDPNAAEGAAPLIDASALPLPYGIVDEAP
ncbi:MAG: hypothetical protein ABIT36_00050 [Steroidobacteraceae bacterium]